MNPFCLVYWRIYTALGLNELTVIRQKDSHPANALNVFRCFQNGMLRRSMRELRSFVCQHHVSLHIQEVSAAKIISNGTHVRLSHEFRDQTKNPVSNYHSSYVIPMPFCLQYYGFIHMGTVHLILTPNLVKSRLALTYNSITHSCRRKKDWTTRTDLMGERDFTRFEFKMTFGRISYIAPSR